MVTQRMCSLMKNRLFIIDGCTGGIVQYFGDKACTQFLGTTSMDGSDGPCIVSTDPSYSYLDHAVYQTTKCTTSQSPSESEQGLTTL